MGENKEGNPLPRPQREEKNLAKKVVPLGEKGTRQGGNRPVYTESRNKFNQTDTRVSARGKKKGRKKSKKKKEGKGRENGTRREPGQFHPQHERGSVQKTRRGKKKGKGHKMKTDSGNGCNRKFIKPPDLQKKKGGVPEKRK